MVTAMTNRPVQSQAFLRIAMTVVILVLLNIISIRIFGRLDVTKNKLFTLSDASKELMRSLDDKITIKAYFTEDLPSPYNSNRRALLDQLNEYKAYSRGNLQLEFIDPSGEKGEQEAQQQGIGPVQVQVVKEDKFEVKRAYMGMVFLYEDKKEVIPVIQNTSTLEYDISSTVKRLTSLTRKKVGFLTGNGEPGLNELSRAQQFIGRQYETATVDLAKGKSVPADIAVLIIMAPATRFAEPEKYQIDQYIMRGGKVAFLLNRVDGDLQNRFGRQVDLNLEDMLDTYGLKIHPDLIRDAQCASISIEQQQMGFQIRSQVPFPYLPLASKFSKNNMMVKDLQGLVFFFVSSVDTANLASKNLQGEVLITSSEQSGRQTTVFMFDPLARYAREDFGEKEIPLAVVVRGQFKSAFAGKPVPADTSAGSLPPTGSTIAMSPENRIVLVGDGDFARDKYLANKDNITFFANIIDYLVDDAGLITIRSKDVSMPPLEQTSDGTKKVLKLANLIFPPVLVLGYGLLRWRMRSARKKAMGL